MIMKTKGPGGGDTPVLNNKNVKNFVETLHVHRRTLR
jgi:hypothetical protein